MRAIIITILLLLRSFLIFTKKDNERLYCKIAPLFAGEGKTEPKTKHNSNIGFCKTLKNTCCSKSDFYKMQAWWEDSSLSLSKSNVKILEMRTLLNVVSSIDQYKPKIIKHVKSIKENYRDAEVSCVSPAYSVHNIMRLDLVKVALRNFKSTAKQCWNYTKQLINGLMCAACDSKAQKYIYTDEKKVIVSDEDCVVFMNHCGTHIKSVDAIASYMSYLNRVALCDEKGHYDGPRNWIDLPDDIILSVNSCLYTKNLDDCGRVCENQMSFTGMTKFENENMNLMRLFAKNITKRFGEGAEKEKVKAMEKRVLEYDEDEDGNNEGVNQLNDNLRKEEEEEEEEEKIIESLDADINVDELFSEGNLKARRVLENEVQNLPSDKGSYEKIENLNFDVMDIGLNFSKYFADNNDGYEEINLNQVSFSGGILVIGFGFLFNYILF